MKAHYKTKSGRLVFEVEGQSPKQLFAAIAELTEVFEADYACGCCNSMNLRFRMRTAQDIDFYELACEDCTATLGFGTRKVGNKLFPQRKDKDNEPLPNRGWKVWRARRTDSEEVEEVSNV